MASFVASFFDKSGLISRPETPTKNNFITPATTPHGSPSKKTVPPGANELPVAVENLKLTASVLDSPVKLSRPQTAAAPLSPGKSNVLAVEDTAVVDDSVLLKTGVSPGSPVRKQGKENTAPASAPRLNVTEPPFQHNRAAISRHELYHLKERPSTPTAKKFNTSRGLTPEELETLQRPGVRRMVNVTQLCK